MVIMVSVILIVLTVSTYIIDQHKSNWGSGPALMFFELVAIGLQLSLTKNISKIASF